MSLPRYPEYKLGGVEWLGEVPGHWEVERLKYSADVRLSNIDKHTVEDEPPVLLCNYVDVYKNERINASIDFMAATASPEQIQRLTLEVGDVIITKDSEDPRDIGVPALVSEVVPDLVCGYHLALLRPRAKKFGGYIYYLFKSRYVAAAFETEATGMTRYALGKYSIENLNVPLPSLEEQQTIAAFLDRETGKIDALIAEQRRLVELLAEKRQAVISHAVTKGLNPNVRMKDSGIEWLGEVPENWEVCAIKRMSLLITDGAHISPETDDGIYDFVSTKDISDAGIDFEGCLKTSPSSYEYLVRSGCQPVRGDVLFSKDGTIGRTVVVKEEREFVVASSLIIIRPDSTVLYSIFLHYLCQSFLVIQQVEGFVKGAGLPRLSIQNLLKVFGVFPQIEEQQAIAAFLNTEIGKFNTLTAEAQRAIALLQERRSALISAAVTGKIDVRKLPFKKEAV